MPEMGTKMIAVTNGDAALGARLAETLGQELFANRGMHMMPTMDEKATVAQALASTAHPVVIADMCDNLSLIHI